MSRKVGPIKGGPCRSPLTQTVIIGNLSTADRVQPIHEPISSFFLVLPEDDVGFVEALLAEPLAQHVSNARQARHWLLPHRLKSQCFWLVLDIVASFSSHN